MEKMEKTNEKIAVNIGNYTGEKPIEIAPDIAIMEA